VRGVFKNVWIRKGRGEPADDNSAQKKGEKEQKKRKNISSENWRGPRIPPFGRYPEKCIKKRSSPNSGVAELRKCSAEKVGGAGEKSRKTMGYVVRGEEGGKKEGKEGKKKRGCLVQGQRDRQQKGRGGPGAQKGLID